jgi:hypothetical protein
VNELVSKITNLKTRIRHLELQHKTVDPFQNVNDPKVIQAKADALVQIEALKKELEVLEQSLKNNPS